MKRLSLTSLAATALFAATMPASAQTPENTEIAYQARQIAWSMVEACHRTAIAAARPENISLDCTKVEAAAEQANKRWFVAARAEVAARKAGTLTRSGPVWPFSRKEETK